MIEQSTRTLGFPDNQSPLMLAELRDDDDRERKKEVAKTEARRWLLCGLVACAIVGLALNLDPFIRTTTENVRGVTIALTGFLRAVMWARVLGS